MAKMPATRPVQPAPVIHVTADIPDPRDESVIAFKQGQELGGDKGWNALIAYTKAVLALGDSDTQVTDKAIREAYAKFPDDSEDGEVERIEWLEGQIEQQPAVPDVSISDDDSPERLSYKQLGALLDDKANEHFDKYTGQAKEDFDGSALVIRADLKRVNTPTKGNFLRKLLSFEPDTYPIGTTTKRSGDPHPKALPSGSNAKPEFYPKDGGKTYGSHIADFCDGTKYGDKLYRWRSFIAKQIRSEGKDAQNNPAPSEAETKAFMEQWRVNEPLDTKGLDSFKKRFDDRARNFQAKVRLALKVLHQEQRMKDVDGLTVTWVHSNPELLQASNAPVRLYYNWTNENGEVQIDNTRNLSLGTFIGYDVEAAMEQHKPGQNFLPLLAKTAGRNRETEKPKVQVNLERPTPIAVWAMATSIGSFLEHASDQDELIQWLNDKKEGDARKEAFHASVRALTRFDSDHVQPDVDRIIGRRNRQAAEQKAKEAEAYGKGHDQAA